MAKDKVEESKKKMVVVEEVAPQEPEEKAEPIVVPTEANPTHVPEPVSVIHQAPDVSVDTVDENRPNYLWIIVPTALLVGAFVGGLITFFAGISKLNEANSTPSPVPSMAATVATPTPASEETLKRDVLKVQVLNGSGVSGAAGKAKALLEGLGYKNVEVGNASVTGLAQTEIAIKDEKQEYLDLVIKDLSSDYQAVEAAKPLVATSKYDLVITLGKK